MASVWNYQMVDGFFRSFYWYHLELELPFGTICWIPFKFSDAPSSHPLTHGLLMLQMVPSLALTSTMALWLVLPNEGTAGIGSLPFEQETTRVQNWMQVTQPRLRECFGNSFAIPEKAPRTTQPDRPSGWTCLGVRVTLIPS